MGKYKKMGRKVGKADQESKSIVKVGKRVLNWEYDLDCVGNLPQLC